MTDVVMSNLVLRNAKFFCTVGVYWPVCSNSLDTKTEKVAVTRGNMCGKQYLLPNKHRKAMGDCLLVGHF